MLIPSSEMLHDKEVQKYTNMYLLAQMRLCVKRIAELEEFVKEHEKQKLLYDWYDSKTKVYFKGQRLTLKEVRLQLKKELERYEFCQHIFDNALKEVIRDCPSKQEIEYWIDSEDMKSDCSR